MLLLDECLQGAAGYLVWRYTVRSLLLGLLLLLERTGSLVEILGEEFGQLLSIRRPCGLDHDLVPSSMLQ